MIAITETCLMEGYQGLSEIVGYDTEICILFSEVSVMRGSIVLVYHHIALQGTTCQLYNLFLPHLQRFSLTRNYYYMYSGWHKFWQAGKRRARICQFIRIFWFQRL